MDDKNHNTKFRAYDKLCESVMEKYAGPLGYYDIDIEARDNSVLIKFNDYDIDIEDRFKDGFMQFTDMRLAIAYIEGALAGCHQTERLAGVSNAKSHKLPLNPYLGS